MNLKNIVRHLLHLAEAEFGWNLLVQAQQKKLIRARIGLNASAVRKMRRNPAVRSCYSDHKLNLKRTDPKWVRSPKGLNSRDVKTAVVGAHTPPLKPQQQFTNRTKKYKLDLNIIVDDVKIPTVNNSKILGITFNSLFHPERLQNVS